MKISVAASLLGLSAVNAIELTTSTWEEQTAGKTVFVKFFAPWCGHCKKMKPDWDELMSLYEGSTTAMVADVDCTSDGGKPKCDEVGVRGFPTLKYGDPSDLQDYQGGRDLASLKKFAEENLKPMCSVTNIDLCDDEKKAQIKKYQDMSDADLASAIEAEEKKLGDAEELFKNEVQKLQKKYEELSQDKDNTMAEVKNSGLGLMKSVKIAKSKAAASDEL